MKIDTTLVEIWNKRLGHIPMLQLSYAIDISRHTVKKALAGHCSFSTMQKINQFLLENGDKQLTKDL